MELNPENIKEFVDEFMDDIEEHLAVLDVVPEIVKAIKPKLEKNIVPILSDLGKLWLDKYIPFVAECNDKLFKELTERGFTRQEALTLVLNHKVVMENLFDVIKGWPPKKSDE